MKIHEIEVRNFRGIEHISITDIPDTGLILLSGPNEEGKSTILEAIHLALTMKSSSTAKNVKSVKPVDRDVAPFVSLQFTLGDQRMKLTKQYLKSAKTELRLSNGTTLTADDAENYLVQQREQYLDDSLFTAMFNRQDKMVADLAYAEITPLEKMLQEGNDEVDPHQGNTLVEKAYLEYLNYFKKTGKESTRVVELRTQLQEAQAATAVLREKLHELDEDVVIYETNTRRLTELEASIPELDAEVALRRTESKQVEQLRANLEQARHKYEIAQQTHRTAQEALTIRDEVLATMNAQAAKVAELEAAVHVATESAEAAKRAQDQLKHEYDELVEQQQAAKQAVEDATTQLRSAKTVAQAAEARQKLAKLAELEQQLEALAEIPVFEQDAVAELEDAWRAKILAAEKLKLNAPTVTVAATVPTDIHIDDAAVTVDAQELQRTLTDEMVVRVGDVTMTVTPAATTAQEDAQQANQVWQQLCEKYDVDDVLTARERRQAWAQAELEQQSFQRDKRAILSEYTQEELETLSATSDGEVVVSVEEAESAVAQAQQVREELAQRREELDAKREAAATSPELVKLQEVKLEHAQEAEYFTREQAKIAELEQRHSYESLQEAVAEATAAKDRAFATFTVREEEFAELRADELQSLLEIAEAKATNTRHQVTQVQLELSRLQAKIEQSGNVATQYEQAKSQEHLLERKYHQQQKDAQAAQTLYETLSHYQKMARERYTTPFVTELQRLAQLVFGRDVTFNVSEDLKVQSRIDANGVSIDKAQLSGGAQEQVEILSRLAVTKMIASAGMPIFFDDVLGSSDETRLDFMGAAFDAVAQNQQVFVLTCVPQRYQSVKLLHEYSLPALKRQSKA
ncbi:AAA family ATPase [Corynebacterium sp. HS2168-gen11]|uniref:AAA family ATPase n=1 Tax=Corynebacterium sp. HS2168-gen11 TaxID=2974027 RepID=UPI00216B0650|nr:AAA family ATPase [Corynebacterium sp. HS2168-gen11]MCS4534888.1 AAA family ATPase [Corynebacterium sp. HS2168-gen11]